MNSNYIVYILGGLILAYLIFKGGEEVFMQTSTWDDIIKKYASNPPRNMTAEDFERLIKAVIQHESNWNDTIVGITGDIGLMQINPVNAPAFGLTRDDLFDVDNNIRVGASILRDDINAYGIRDGLAAYNGGPTKRNIAVTQTYATNVLNIYNSIA